MKIIKGDLIEMAKEGKFDIIIHGANTFHTMGGGIALQIAKTFPDALKSDKLTKFGDIDKMGSFSATYNRDSNLIICNAYTQFSTGEYCGLSYKAIRSCFKSVAEFTKKYAPHWTIGYPKIGAGLGGGDWNIISKIIDEELKGLTHTLVEYSKGG